MSYHFFVYVQSYQCIGESSCQNILQCVDNMVAGSGCNTYWDIEKKNFNILPISIRSNTCSPTGGNMYCLHQYSLFLRSNTYQSDIIRNSSNTFFNIVLKSYHIVQDVSKKWDKLKPRFPFGANQLCIVTQEVLTKATYSYYRAQYRVIQQLRNTATIY